MEGGIELDIRVDGMKKKPKGSSGKKKGNWSEKPQDETLLLVSGSQRNTPQHALGKRFKSNDVLLAYPGWALLYFASRLDPHRLAAIYFGFLLQHASLRQVSVEWVS